MTSQKPTVSQVLEKMGLEEHAQLFEENAIDYDAFMALQESDLCDLNIPIGIRAKIRKEIEGNKHEENAGNDK